jgi:hypothetical protein
MESGEPRSIKAIPGVKICREEIIKKKMEVYE